MCVYRRKPAPPLDRFVDVFWLYEGAPQTHAKERVLPTGTLQLIINLREDKTRIYDRSDYRLSRISYNPRMPELIHNGITMATKVKPVPDGFHTATPYLLVEDGDKQIQFLKQAFDAQEVHLSRLPDGRMLHAEVKIGDSMVMIGQARDPWKPMPAMVYLYVEDVDRTFGKAIAAGGKSLREVKDEFYGDRSGGVQDPSGNTWWIATHVEDVSREELDRRFAAMGQQH